MEFRILGSLEVTNRGGPVSFVAPKHRAVLGVLLLHPNEVVSTERLIDELWGARPPATATKVIHTYVSQLRKALGADLIDTQPPGYLLRVEDDALDAVRFRQLVAEGRALAATGEHERARSRYSEALALWRGPPLADVTFESFARSEVERMKEERLAALMDRIDCDLALGEHNRLVAELESLAKQHPLHERLRAQLMLALYRSGRQADALAAYQDARRTLLDDLGLEPGRELQDLEAAILRHDAALQAPRRRRVEAPPLRPAWLFALVAALLAAAAFGLSSVLGSDEGGISAVSPNAIGVIDAKTNELVAEVPVGVEPEAVAVGAGGVWVANVADETVSRVDPATRRLVRTISLAEYPSDIALGAGSVWVALGSIASVTRIEPERSEATRPISALGKEVLSCGRPFADLASGGGALWFSCESAEFGRVDPRTRTSMRVGYDAGLLISPRAVVPRFSDIAFGLGSVWLANRGTNSIVQIDPFTNRVVTEITVGRAPMAIAVGLDSIWVANLEDDSVSRIETNGSVEPPTVHTIAVGDRPVDVAVGEGSVWVANDGDRTVSRIDPSRNVVVAEIALGNEPGRLVVGVGAVWVSVRAPDDDP